MEPEKKEGIPAGRAVPETGRRTSARKLEVVLRLLRGEISTPCSGRPT